MRPPSVLAGRSKDLLSFVTVSLLALGILEVATRSGTVSRLVMPPPSAIADTFLELLGSSWFYEDIGVTAAEAALGFLAAVVVALTLAVILAHVKLLRALATPYIVAFQVLPKVALAPTIIIWLGFGMSAKVAVSFAISFFVIFANTMKGIDRVPRWSVALMRSLCASRRQQFTMLTVPFTLPYIFAGLRSGATLALIGAIVAEFITARAGLGRLVVTASANFEIEQMWVATITMAFLGAVFYGSMAALQKRLVRW